MGTYIFEDTYKKTQELERQREGLPPIERDKRRVGWFHWFVLFVGICMMVYGMNSDAVVQEVPVYDANAIQALRDESAALKNLADIRRALVENLERQVANHKAVIAQYELQLKALSASVPSQPVILEVIQKEAVTEKGLRQVVARNFGRDIVKRVRVTND